MSAGPDPRTGNAKIIAQERQKLGQRLDEVARLCETGMPASAFYGEVLQRLIESLAAVAGAIWLRTPQGNLQRQFQINIEQTGLDPGEAGRQSHDALLRAAFTAGHPVTLPPRATVGPAEEGRPAPGNPSNCILLLVPVRQNEQVVGLLEIFQESHRPPSAIQGFVSYMVMMAELVGRYQRNQLVNQLVSQQTLWTQLESYARNIHGSLSPTEVAFHVANEGRRLIECDRVCVAVRRSGQKSRVEAVSGTDIVEHRSNMIRHMRDLCDAVLDWGERLVYTGVKDESLPPKVLATMDAYLQESSSKLLIVMPQHDEREGDGKAKPRLPARSALVIETFETPADTQQLIARLEVVSRHATPALYNAIEHYRIPMRYLWMPIAKLQEGLGGKTKAITILVVLALSLIGAGLYAFPYSLKMEATGKVLPTVRRTLYSPYAGVIRSFEVEANERVPERRSLAKMYDPTLYKNINDLRTKISSAEIEANGLEEQFKSAPSESEKKSARSRATEKRAALDGFERELRELISRTNSLSGQPGWYSLLAPTMTSEEADQVEDRLWTVLSTNFKQDFEGKEVKPSEPIMQLGAKNGPWEIELKIPQKHIGQVLRGFEGIPEGEALEVNFLLKSENSTLLKGKLYRNRIAGEANPNREDSTEAEPVVIAYVRIDGEDIPEGYRADLSKLISGTEVSAKIDCGKAKAGYALFYGVWEFMYEKVVFYLF